MAGLVPFAQIVDLTSDIVLASTQNIIDYSVEWCLDKVGTLSIEVGAGDAGDGAGGTAFAAALLEAASDLGAAPKPLLLEFSLDGGASFDSRKMVEQPQRTLKASERTIREDGADLAATLSTVPQERVTFTDCKLVDVFNGAAGGITPLASSGLVSGPIPHLHGLLTVTPGKSSWAGSYRLVWTGVVDPVVQITATNVDTDSATTLAAAETVVNRLAGAFISGDSVPQGYRGHYVADPSDSALNLGGHARAFVVGNVAASASGGSTTTPHLTFDASGAYDLVEPFPQDTIARLHLDSATLKTDDTTLVPACTFVGGKSTAGFPDGAKVTGLTVLNGTSTTALADDHWLNGVPVIGVNVNDTSGGLYFTVLDGTIRPVPGSPATACQSIGTDAGDDAAPRPFALLMGSPHGVYMAESVDVLSTGAGITWALLGDLNADVVRLNVKINPADTTHRVVFALVRGTGERTDGIHRWTNATGWQTVIQNTRIVDMVATDYQTLWVVFSQPQNTLYRYGISGGVGTEQAHYALPGAGQISHVQEVVTVSPSPGQDSVWVLTEGAPSPAYYLLNTSGAWGAWHDANQDSTLHGPDTTPLQLNRAVGLGVAFEGVTPAVLVGTDQGVYGSTPGQPLGGALGWKSLNEQGGLANYNIKSIAAGEAQAILGTTLNRIFCTTEDDLLYSNSSGRWWETVKGRDRTDAGAHLSTITISITNANDPVTGGGHSGQTLPYNRVRTWGTTNGDGTPMTTSPVTGDVGAHVSIPVGHPDEVPQGYYFERYLDQHLDYQYRYVSEDCPFAGLQMAQLPDLQSNAAVDADRASAGVMTVARRWLPQHAVPQTTLEVESAFSDAGAALRSLRPTHRVRVDGQVIIADVTSSGQAVTTRVWDAQGASLWVLAHSMSKGVGMTATTKTTLGTQLVAGLPTEADIARSLADSVSSLKVWR